MDVLELRRLRASDPGMFFINWRRLDPLGFAFARMGASADSLSGLSGDDLRSARRAHFALVDRFRRELGLTKSDVRRFREV